MRARHPSPILIHHPTPTSGQGGGGGGRGGRKGEVALLEPPPLPGALLRPRLLLPLDREGGVRGLLLGLVSPLPLPQRADQPLRPVREAQGKRAVLHVGLGVAGAGEPPAQAAAEAAGRALLRQDGVGHLREQARLVGGVDELPEGAVFCWGCVGVGVCVLVGGEGCMHGCAYTPPLFETNPPQVPNPNDTPTPTDAPPQQRGPRDGERARRGVVGVEDGAADVGRQHQEELRGLFDEATEDAHDVHLVGQGELRLWVG